MSVKSTFGGIALISPASTAAAAAAPPARKPAPAAPGGKPAGGTGSIAAATAAVRPDVMGVASAFPAGPAAIANPGTVKPPVIDPGRVVNPGLIFDPGILGALQPQPKTATMLAERSIDILDETSPGDVRAAISAIRARIQNKRISGVEQLFFLLERRTRIAEIYARRAAQWSAEDREDFRTEFQIREDQTAVMDAIASIAVLNDADLDSDIQAEHLGEGVDDEAIENRRVVWQYPPPGTPMEPPFTVLLAVERVDLAAAQAAVDEITGRLGTFEGIRLPHATIRRLG